VLGGGAAQVRPRWPQVPRCALVPRPCKRHCR
jgi:hypothetical protein